MAKKGNVKEGEKTPNTDDPKAAHICANCFWWKEHKQCRNTDPSDTCKDFKDRNSTCSACKFFRKRKMCMEVTEWDTCDQWEIGKAYETCQNCLTKETCRDTAKGTCDKWQPKLVKEETKAKREQEKEKKKSGSIREMLTEGKNPQEIADALGIKLACSEVVVDLKTSPDAILKSNLVTALNLLQLAELNYKEYMTHSNLSVVNETISTVQSLVKDLQGYQDPLKFYHQLDEAIIQAATKGYLQILTTELHEMRNRLYELIPVQRHSVAQKMFADFFDGIAANLKMQYTDIRRVLARTLGVEAQVEYLNADSDAPTGRQKITRGNSDDKVGYETDRDDDR